jgi:serine/threonine protein kinase
MPQLDGFEDFTEIGRGGFGVVYRARQPALNRYVAIKFLAASLNSSGRERLAREALAMGALSGHPNIVSVVDVGIPTDGEPYLVMPYMARGSLADALASQGPRPWPDVVRFGVKLSGALESAHRLGILHRDVKPGNVLLSDFGEPELADFGLARVAGGFETTSRHITASVAHAAPEILEGQPPSAAADVYSLASTLYTLIAGHPAFIAADDESLVALYVRIASSPVPPLDEPGVPESLNRALSAAMSKERDQRPISAEQFGRMLQDVEASEGLPVTELPIREPSPSLPPVGSLPPPAVSGPTRVTKPARSTRRRWAWIAVAVAGALVAAIAAGVLVTRDDSPAGNGATASAESDQPSATAASVSCLRFPGDVPWYQPIDNAPTSGKSADYIASINAAPRFEMGTFHAGFDAEDGGALYNVVSGPVSDPQPVVFSSETDKAASDDTSQFPIQSDTVARDQYLIIIDDATCTSYELFGLDDTEPWTQATSAAVFDLNANQSRQDGQPSAIQSGLPMFPMLVRYDEVKSGTVDHALLFNAPTQSSHFMAPATMGIANDDASSDADLPPIGSRFRLKSGFDCGGLSTTEARTICATLKTYGMYLGGSSGSLFDLQGVHDARWTDDILDDIKRMEPGDFEVVDTGQPIK